MGYGQAGMSRLWVYAHESEGRGIVDELGAVVLLGTGKAAAAAALGRVLVERAPTQVVVFGVAGAYPGSGLSVGDVCLVGEDRLADDGVLDERGFRDLAAMELGDPGPFRADVEATTQVAGLLGVPIVGGATVSTCSATDTASAELAARTGADVETMEGAAIGLACAAASVPWVQLRAISNMTGNRESAGWDFERAIDRLHSAVRAILTAGAGL